MVDLSYLIPSQIDGVDVVTQKYPLDAPSFTDAVRRHSWSEAARLGEPFCGGLIATGFGAVYDGGEVISRRDLTDLEVFYDLLFSIPPTILRQFPGDGHKFGYMGPGDEAYDGGPPERWKSSWYWSLLGEQRQYPEGYWPQGDQLVKIIGDRIAIEVEDGFDLVGTEFGEEPFTPEEARFFTYATLELLPRISRSQSILSKAPMNALGFVCFGLPGDHFNGADYQHEDGRGFGTHRALAYHGGPDAKEGDVFAGGHFDTSPSALITLLRSANRKRRKAPCLEVTLADGSTYAIGIPAGSHSYNIGRPVPAYFNALRALGLIGNSADEIRLASTWHGVIRRVGEEASFKDQERFGSAHFDDWRPSLKIGERTLRQIEHEDIARHVERVRLAA